MKHLRRQVAALAAAGLALCVHSSSAVAQPAGIFQVGSGLTNAQMAQVANTATGVQLARDSIAAASAVNRVANRVAGAAVRNSILANTYANAYNSSPYSPYSPYNSWLWADPYGGYMRGVADIVNSQGRFMVNQQQAFQMYEQVKSARISNRRAAFDEYLYERQHTPTLEDDRQHSLQEQLRRSLNNPPVTEVWSGKALNDILANLQKTLPRGDVAALSTFPLSLGEEDLKRLNLAPAKGAGNLGLLKHEGKLDWPVALSGPSFKTERERISSLAQEAVKQAEFNGKVGAGTILQLSDDVAQMRKELKTGVDDLPPSLYMEAASYLNNVDDAIKALQTPYAASYFRGKYTLKAKSIPDLVKFMSDNGLQFMSAVPGDETAYQALHQALVAYALSARPEPALSTQQ